MRGFGPHRREPPALEEAAPGRQWPVSPSTPRRAVEVDGRGRPPVRGDLLQRAPVRDERVVRELSTAEDAALIAPLACPAAPGVLRFRGCRHPFRARRGSDSSSIRLFCARTLSSAHLRGSNFSRTSSGSEAAASVIEAGPGETVRQMALRVLSPSDAAASNTPSHTWVWLFAPTQPLGEVLPSVIMPEQREQVAPPQHHQGVLVVPPEHQKRDEAHF